MRQWPVTLILLASKSHIKVTIVFSPGSFDRTFGYHGNSKYGSILLQKKTKKKNQKTKQKTTLWAAALLEMVQKSSWRAAKQKM